MLGINWNVSAQWETSESPSLSKPMRPTILFLTLIAPSKATLSPSTDSIIKHSWGDIPRGWTYHSTPPPDDTFELRIGLKQARIDELIDRLLEISDPNHSRYAYSNFPAH